MSRAERPRVAALYVHPRGPYFGRSDVDPWPESRDARLYAGPWPVVAHPPCARWGRYWSGGPSPTARRRELGDDGGCFAAALAAVRTFGGVLEHPEGSHAWRRFGLVLPPRHGGWIAADLLGGWTCCVEQGHYGHPAAKATWLYAAGIPGSQLPELAWGKSDAAHPLHRRARLDLGYHSRAERAKAVKRGTVTRLSKTQAQLTPPAFAEVLISLAHLAAEGAQERRRA